MKSIRAIVASAVCVCAVAAGSALSAGAANADVGWIGPFSSSWTCEQNAWSYGWEATCSRFDDGWYWWSPR